jgi:DNA-binding HxlR family transcriptional regulator
MDNKTKDALKQMQSELRAVQSAIEQLRLALPQSGADQDGVSGTPATGAKSPVGFRMEAKALADLLAPSDGDALADADAAAGYAVVVRPPGIKAVRRHAPPALPFARLRAATDEQVAIVANALSAPPKVAILRALFAVTESKESAATLGEQTKLSSGSLYYHLRDLTHAGLIEQATRGHYSITVKGQCALLLMSALAVEG